MERECRHHPARGRKYMHDDAASRKSGNDDALGRKGRCTFTHKLCVKAGSPKRGEAPLSKKDAPQGSRYGKLSTSSSMMLCSHEQCTRGKRGVY